MNANMAKITVGAALMAFTVTTSHAITYSVERVESWNYRANVTLRGVKYDNEVATAIRLTTADPSVGAAHQSIWTYCTDLTGLLSVPQVASFDRISAVGQTGLDARNPWGAGGFENAAFLVDKYGAAASSDPVAAGGLALAVWKSLYDSTGLQQGNFDFKSGNFRVRSVTDSGMLADAKTYLASLSGADYTPINNYWLRPNPSGFPGNVGQGLIDPVRGGGGSVPDGGVSVLMLGAAVSGLFFMRQKQNVLIKKPCSEVSSSHS
jgi:hypothetical protein